MSGAICPTLPAELAVPVGDLAALLALLSGRRTRREGADQPYLPRAYYLPQALSIAS